jgi:hypothetical protein
MGPRRFRFTIQALMIIVAVAAIAVTWVKWAQRRTTSPVSGTISFNGRPVGNGKIVFLPPSPAGQQATGQIINGKYSLADGAFPGSYDIVIVSPSVPAPYQSQATTPLRAMVQERSNVIDFNLN